MRYLLIILLLITLGAGHPSPAKAQQTITLKDGSAIKGKLVEVANGVYVVESPTMGTIKVPEEQVLAVQQTSDPNALIASDGKISSQALDKVKMNMMSDPEIISLIQELLQDPSIADLVKNPALMQTALSMDPERIQNDPSVKKLLEHPTMQKILQKTSQSLQK